MMTAIDNGGLFSTKIKAMQKCKILIPGLDFNFCVVCGYVPRQHYLDYLNRLKERGSTSKGKTHEDLTKEIKLAELKKSKCKAG